MAKVITIQTVCVNCGQILSEEEAKQATPFIGLVYKGSKSEVHSTIYEKENNTKCVICSFCN